MHYSWVTGGNEQWFSYWAPPVTDLASATFFYFLFPGGYIGHQPLWQVWNKKDWGMRVLLFNHFQGVMKRRLGVSPFQLHESPVILHLLHCHSLLEPDLFFFFFFQEEKVHDFISNLSLPFLAGNWKQSHQEAASGGSECWPGGTYRVYKCLLIIFRFFFSSMYSWDEHLTNSKGSHV